MIPNPEWKIQVEKMGEIIFVAPLNPECPRGPVQKAILPELQKIRFRGLLKHHLRVTAHEHQSFRVGVKLQFEFKSYDVVSDATTYIRKEAVLDQSILDRRLPIEYWFWEELRGLLLHELAESFLFGGKPYLEPHPELFGSKQLDQVTEKIDRELVELYEMGKPK